MQTLFQNDAIQLVAERRGAGAFDIYAIAQTTPQRATVPPSRTRLGVVSGRAGHWSAEDANGKHLSCFNSRADAAQMLWNTRSASARSTTPSKPLPFSLSVGEQLVMWGDEPSVAVVFNNLEGRNFEGERPPAIARSDYLDYMAREFKVPLAVGTAIAWGRTGGQTREHGVIRKV